MNVPQSIPVTLEAWIDSELKNLGASLWHSKLLADSIKKMSDFYAKTPTAPTPWSEPWCVLAQLSYYFPLNYLRNQRVFKELQSLNFFENLHFWHEFGVGLAPSIEAYLQQSSKESKFPDLTFVEASHTAKVLTDHRLRSLYEMNAQWKSQLPKVLGANSLLVMSYALTEQASIPSWVWSADSIIIIEPSTREDGRRLMTLRQEALEQGFQAVAPCTHQQACPLLTRSKRDWCHDRIHVKRPEWLLAIENHLPFSNPTITLSYLALTKQKHINASPDAVTRVVGDFLVEKGKTRQLVCRGPQREFLTFLKKNDTPLEFQRGDLLQLAPPLLLKGEEIRLHPSQIKKI